MTVKTVIVIIKFICLHSGYVADFGDDRPKALKLSKQLESLNWIDRYTRAVFAEFTTYNAQTSFFTVITLLTEILPTGGYYHSPKIQTLRLYRYVGPEMVFVMACEITYMAFLLYFLYKQVLKHEGFPHDVVLWTVQFHFKLTVKFKMTVATTLDSEVVTVFLTNRLGHQSNTYGDILVTYQT